MDTPDKAPEVQISAQAQPASSGSQPEHSSAVPPELPPQSPPDASPPTMSESANKNEKSNAGIIWAVVVIVGLIVLVAIFGSGSGSGSSTSSSSGNGSSGGGGGYTPAPAYIPPVSKALDEKNGFKDFKFGMTPDEARAVLAPTQVNQNPGAKEEVFLYSGTAANRIGEFATDALGLRFFEGRLFRIDIRFSSFPNEIFEALKINYGEAVDNGTWTRGKEALTAKCWQGEKVSAAILAASGQSWDTVVILDQAANQKAQEYAGKEPERAARDFSSTGFKSLTMGMRLQDLTDAYVVSEDSPVTGVKKVVFKTGDWLAVGFYRLRYVSAEFFKDRLFRIDLSFEDNRKEIFQSFQNRFSPLQSNTTWTRGSEKLTAKSGGNEKLYGTILAPGGSYGGEEWDAIVMLELAVQREAEQFKQDAPKRAAKDL